MEQTGIQQTIVSSPVGESVASVATGGPATGGDATGDEAGVEATGAAAAGVGAATGATAGGCATTETAMMVLVALFVATLSLWSLIIAVSAAVVASSSGEAPIRFVVSAESVSTLYLYYYAHQLSNPDNQILMQNETNFHETPINSNPDNQILMQNESNFHECVKCS